MTRRTPAARLALTLLSLAAAAGCGRADTTLRDVQRLRSGTLEVILLSPRDALRHGKDTFTIEFRSTPGGALVDVGAVRMRASMPMPGSPMFGSVDVRPTNVPGRYTADAQFDMAGAWRMTLEWNGTSGQQSVSFSSTVQ